MVNDRGNKKWPSLMLHEHVTALKHLFLEEGKADMRIIDEQQQIINDRKLMNAVTNQKEVEIKYISNEHIRVITGKVIAINRSFIRMSCSDQTIDSRTIVEINDY